MVTLESISLHLHLHLHLHDHPTNSNLWLQMFLNTIFVSNHMYPENPEGTQVIVCFMNTGYDIIYPTLSGLELATCSVTSAPIPLVHCDGRCPCTGEFTQSIHMTWSWSSHSTSCLSHSFSAKTISARNRTHSWNHSYTTRLSHTVRISLPSTPFSTVPCECQDKNICPIPDFRQGVFYTPSSSRSTNPVLHQLRWNSSLQICVQV